MIEDYLCSKGANIYYKVIGEGEPILFLHGGPGFSHDYFLPHFLKLADMGYQLVFMDQRGGGRSVEPYHLDSITIDNLVEDIESLRKHLNLSSMHLMGHSFGGYLAVRYAMKYAENLNKMILCNCASFNRSLVMKGDEIRNQRMLECGNPLMAFFYDKSKMELLHPGLYFMNGENYEYTSKKLGEESFESLKALNISNISTPCLILHGEYDFIPQEASAQLAKKLQSSELYTVRNAGHFSFIEKRDEVIEIIESYLRGEPRYE